MTMNYAVGAGICLLLLGLNAQAADSLFDAGTYRSMIADKRAVQVGDMVTVVVTESSSTTTSADTSLQRTNSVGLQAQGNGQQHGLSIAANNDFDGGGRIARTGRILAQLNVNVTAISENGDMQISGEQEIELNSDRQHIRLEGRVRPVDLSATNTVPSNRIADLKLSYVGNGELAQRLQPGFWSRAMTWLGF
jgi:flagellar L-ring protein FlgH